MKIDIRVMGATLGIGAIASFVNWAPAEPVAAYPHPQVSLIAARPFDQASPSLNPQRAPVALQSPDKVHSRVALVAKVESVHQGHLQYRKSKRRHTLSGVHKRRRHKHDRRSLHRAAASPVPS